MLPRSCANKFGSRVIRSRVVNEALRIGLNAPETKKSRAPFVARPRPLGLPAGMSYENIGDLLEQLDGPLRK